MNAFRAEVVIRPTPWKDQHAEGVDGACVEGVYKGIDWVG